MLQVPRWKQALILLVVLGSCWLAAGNFVPQAWRDSGFFSKQVMHLGLDLQGGSYLLLEADADRYFKEQLDQIQEEVRGSLREAKEDGSRLAYEGLRAGHDAITFTLKNPEDADLVEDRLSNLTRDMELTIDSTGAAHLAYRDAAKKRILSDLLGQSMEIVRRRVDETGTREPLIQKQGDYRILLQVPGLVSPVHL